MGPAFLQPTMCSGFVCFEWLSVFVWVSVSAGRSFGARACMFLFPNYNINFELLHTRGSVHGLVYKHCISVYRAFSVLNLLCLVFIYTFV